MALLGTLQVRLGLDSSTFTKGLTSFSRDVKGQTSGIANSFRNLIPTKAIVGSLGALASAATAVSFANMIREANDLTDSMGEVSARLGITTQDLQAYRIAAQFAGSDSKTLDKSLGFLARNLGNIRAGLDTSGKKSGILESLGLSKDEIANAPVDDVFEKVVAGLSRIEDPATRSAAAIQLFGKSAGDLNLLFGEGAAAIEKARDLVAQFGVEISDLDAARAGQLNDNFDKLGIIFTGLKVKIASELAPELINLTNRLLATSSTGETLGQRLANGIKGATESFNSFVTAVRGGWNAISAGFNLFQAGIAGVAATLLGFAAEVVKTVGTRIPESFNALLSVGSVVLSTLKQGFADFATDAANFVIAGMNKAVESIHKLATSAALDLNLVLLGIERVTGKTLPLIDTGTAPKPLDTLNRLPVDPVDLSGFQLPTFGGDLATGLGDYSKGFGIEAKKQLNDAAQDYRDIIDATFPILDGGVLPPKPLGDLPKDLADSATSAKDLAAALGGGGGGKTTGSGGGGATSVSQALEEIVPKARVVGEDLKITGLEVGNVWTESMNSIGSAIDQFVQTGKISFKDLGSAILQSIASAAIKNAINYLASAFAGATGGGANNSNADGWIGTILRGIQSVSSYEGGGYTGPGQRTGGVDGRGGRFAIVHPNETVIDHDRVRTTGNRGRKAGMSLSVPITLMPGVSKEELAQILPLLKKDIIQTIPALIARGGRAAAAYGQ